MKKSTVALIIIIIVLVAALGGLTAFYFIDKNKDDDDNKKSKNETEQVEPDEEEPDGEDKDPKAEEKEKKASKGSDIDTLAKDFGKALESESKIEKFLKDNTDYEAFAAMNLLDDAEEDLTASAFEKYLKKVTDDDIDDAKDDVDEMTAMYSSYIGSSLVVTEVGSTKTSEILPMFKEVSVTLEDEDEEEQEWTFFLNDGKLVVVIPSSYVSMFAEN